MKKIVKNIIIIGGGLHFRERYHRVLHEINVERGIKILLLVDLQQEEDTIRNFFSDKALVPDNYLFLANQYRNSIGESDLEHLINDKDILGKTEAVLICTEPKVHKVYSLWAIKNKFDVFVDKPLTAFHNMESCDSLYDDYLSIEKEVNKNKINYVISCERRAHIGYEYVKSYIQKLIVNFLVPITHIDIHFAGGKWNMPDEFSRRENHPYKYGYGVLLHSGYHYIDLLVSLQKLNQDILNPKDDSPEVNAMSFYPKNILRIINNKVYNNLLNTNKFEDCFEKDKMDEMDSFGETDVILMGKFKYEKEIMSHFSLKLIETSVTSRSWDNLPQNDYLDNGRIRQELVIVHLGPVCSIHITSGSYTKKKAVGHIEEFSIKIINNATITGLDQIIYVDRTTLSQLNPELNLSESMNVKARQWQLNDFMNGNQGNSNLKSHEETIKLLNEVYKELKNKALEKGAAYHETIL